MIKKILICFIGLTLTIASSQVMAATSTQPAMAAKITGLFQYSTQILAQVKWPTALDAAESGGAPSSCQQAYRRLYAAPTLEITVAFGYDDSRPLDLVLDSYVATAFSQTLLRPCTGSLSICGFTQGSLFFSKAITGPDHVNRTVNLKVVSASLSASDDINRGQMAAMQRAASNEARLQFLTSISTSDIVFYLGHSRYGYGPDFSVPRLTSGQLPDEAWYRADRASTQGSWAEILSDMAGSKIKLFGMFSCNSQHYFSESLHLTLPGQPTVHRPGLILTSRDTAGQEDWHTLLASLNVLLGLQCEQGFFHALNSTPGFEDHAHSLDGFFEHD